MWCKQSTRKHKKWEGDAFLIAKPPTSRLVILKDPEGKEIGRGSGLAISKVQELEAGSTISFRSGHLLHSVGIYSQGFTVKSVVFADKQSMFASFVITISYDLCDL